MWFSRNRSANPPSRSTLRTKYFQGRGKIIGAFALRIEAARDQNYFGTNFLVRGPSGCGRTALLEECLSISEKEGWASVPVPPEALWNRDILLQCLEQAQVRVPQRTLLEERNPSWILRDVQPPLVLVLEHAHKLKQIKKLDWKVCDGYPGSLLQSIHNGGLGKPLILLCTGHGYSTEAFFDAAGIVRFESSSLWTMGALEEKEMKEVIHSWLREEGGAAGDILPWREDIAGKVQGWPAFLPLYVQPALNCLKQTGGRMTEEGLQLVLEQGDRRKEEYMASKLSRFTAEEMNGIAEMFRRGKDEDGLYQKESLRKSFPEEYPEDQFDMLWEDVQDCGILDWSGKRGGLRVGIPGMDSFCRTAAHRNRENPPDMER